MKKLFLLALITSGFCWGQVYQVRKTTTNAASAEIVTIQQPASGSRQVTFISLYLDCTGACTWTLERNGTAATATSLAVNNVNPGEMAPATTAWSGSNVGSGTVIAAFNCANACNLSIDLTGITFAQGAGTSSNLTIRGNSNSVTVDIVFKYSEKTL